MIKEKSQIKQVKQQQKHYHDQGEEQSISDEIIRVQAQNNVCIRYVGMS